MCIVGINVLSLSCNLLPAWLNTYTNSSSVPPDVNWQRAVISISDVTSPLQAFCHQLCRKTVPSFALLSSLQQHGKVALR